MAARWSGHSPADRALYGQACEMGLEMISGKAYDSIRLNRGTARAGFAPSGHPLTAATTVAAGGRELHGIHLAKLQQSLAQRKLESPQAAKHRIETCRRGFA